MSTKEWIEKDFYKVLGVAKDAKPEDCLLYTSPSPRDRS